MGESNQRASWNKVGIALSLKYGRILVNSRKPRRSTAIDNFWGYETEVKERIERKERLTLGSKVNEENHLAIYGDLEKN